MSQGAAAIHPRTGSDWSDNEAAVTPNYPSHNSKKAPILRERDVALSVQQQPGRRPSQGNSAATTPNAKASQPRGRSPAKRNRRQPSVSRRGSAPVPAPAMTNDGYYNLDDGVSGPSVSRSRSIARRRSTAPEGASMGRSVSRSRQRAESPKPPFVVETPSRATPSKPAREESKKKVDPKEVDRLWREELRAADRERTGDDDDIAEANAAGGGGRRSHSMMSVYMKQQGKRGHVEPPPTRLEQEIPYDYIRVAKNERGSRNQDNRPPAVIAVPKMRLTQRQQQQNVQRGTVRPREPSPARNEVVYTLDDSNNNNDRSLSRDPSPQRSPARASSTAPLMQLARPGESVREDSFRPSVALDESERSQALSQASQTTTEARRTAYQQWRSKTADALYREVYAPPIRCEMQEVPPYFEPLLTAEENDMSNESASDESALHECEEKVLRYRLAMQEGVKKTSIEDIQLSAANAEAVLPLVRAVRHRHEEENWRSAIETIERNQARVAERADEEVRLQADYEAALKDYEDKLQAWHERRRAAAASEGEQPAPTARREVIPATEEVVVKRFEREITGDGPDDGVDTSERKHASTPPPQPMASAAINSATTPGWMRHREFSGNEWSALNGRRRSRTASSAPSSARNFRGAGATREVSLLDDGAGPRNPNQPAWIHHLNAAQAKEEANDPQQQRLNEIEVASSIPRTRQTGNVAYSLGQSHRVRQNSSGGDFGSEESLSFGRSPETSSMQYAVIRPTRVDVTGQHEKVVENDLPQLYGEWDESEFFGRFGSGAEYDDERARRARQAGFGLGNEDGEGGFGRKPKPPQAPQELPPLTLEKVSFTIFNFSSFEATQELKRITWWCAAHSVDAFTIRVGEEDGYTARKGYKNADGSRRKRQPRSFSPTFFPGTARFYDEALTVVTKDLWLRKRVTVAAHDKESGEIDFEITFATLREAREQLWLNDAEAAKAAKTFADGDHETNAAAAGQDGGEAQQPEPRDLGVFAPQDDELRSQELYPTSAQNHRSFSELAMPPPVSARPGELMHTARPNEATYNSTQPPPGALGSTSPPPPTAEGQRYEKLEPSTEPLSFFTDRPHPNGAASPPRLESIQETAKRLAQEEK